MHPFTSFSAQNTTSSGERPKSPTGIDALYPQSDTIILNGSPRHQSPIGSFESSIFRNTPSPIGSVDNINSRNQSPIGSIDNSSFTNSPPVHIRNIFSPQSSQHILKALSSPNASEGDFGEEEFDSYRNSPYSTGPGSQGLSDFDEFVGLSMGGMEDVGDSTFQQPANLSFGKFQSHPFHHDANSMNGSQFRPLSSLPSASTMYNPNFRSAHTSFLPQHPQQQQQQHQPHQSIFTNSFDNEPSLFGRPQPRQMPYDYQNDSVRQMSSSYDSINSQFHMGNQEYLPRGPPVQRNPNSKSPIGSYHHANQFPQNNFQHAHSLSHPQSPPQNGMNQGWNEHPGGEHPSRTLFVRNINSSVEDGELKILFEAYGPIRSMYTLSKHRGFVMISYYDIRNAKQAMRGLQGRMLKRRKLDIHYSIPKDNPSEKDQNQGTLVVFNLDPSITKEELRMVFGAHGEIKEIRETPNKRHHKFIEFYDVRCAEKAIKALNRTEIRSKKIKIEPSRPGGRKNSSRDDPSAVSHDKSSNRRSNRSISLPPGGGQEGSPPSERRATPRQSTDDKKQYALDLYAVESGLDTRTTLMIKNIPNKYTQRMLLSTVDDLNKGKYDFFYLPIDFKNECNVGYAFINFINPLSIIPFFGQLDNTKWGKFNSEKVCNITYARIQGKESLIQHFQNSSLMSEDKKCRPIIFHSSGSKMGLQAPFPIGVGARTRKDEQVKKTLRSRSYSCK